MFALRSIDLEVFSLSLLGLIRGYRSLIEASSAPAAVGKKTLPGGTFVFFVLRIPAAVTGRFRLPLGSSPELLPISFPPRRAGNYFQPEMAPVVFAPLQAGGRRGALREGAGWVMTEGKSGA